MEFLIACLPTDRNGTVDTVTLTARLEARRLNWQALAQMAGKHGMLPMLTHALASVHFHLVPAHVKEMLLVRHMGHVRQVLRSISALVELQGYFDRQQLQAVSWKGPSLGVDLYGMGALRESADLDLLVALADAPRAIEIVTYLGYERHVKATKSRRRKLIARLDQELCFYRASDRIYLELHTQILPSRFASWQDMHHSLGRTESHPLVSSFDVETLEPGDLLISLCGHAIKHHWEKLKWLADIARFLETYRDSLDWAHLATWSRRRGRFAAVLHCCGLASEVFGVALPEAISPRTEQEQQALELSHRVAVWLRAGAEQPMHPNDISRQLALLCRGRISYLRFTARRLLEPQLVDLRDESSRFAHPAWSKWRRLARELSVGGMIAKTWNALHAVR
jgi:hypothetical protein